ncbi:uncharacterized protein LOC132905545 [Bombus pascuorum]|uniref:uncharacterized protein LOC132905545 n=1 Tax=Bombus pascuorum TaxID=65598 RepID=UPI00298DA862|nr:uncharacterized protein LOC132905545 [Bombus pascuorum]
MTSTSGADCVSIEQDRVDAVNIPLRIPPFWSHDVALWFLMLESQFEVARITSDKTKFHTAVTNITAQHVQLVRDILFDPPETGQYEHLKKELIRTGRLGLHESVETGPTTTTNTKRRFTVADVNMPIIGVDFLSHYGLVVKPRNRRHSDKASNLRQRDTRTRLRLYQAKQSSRTSTPRLRSTQAGEGGI